MDEVVDSWTEHADYLGGRPGTGHRPIHQLEQRRQHPVVERQVGAEGRDRSRVSFLGAHSYGAQPVSRQSKDQLLMAISGLGGPAQPGTTTAEWRVMVKPSVSLYRRERSRINGSEIKRPHRRRPGEKTGLQAVVRLGSEYLDDSGLSKVMTPPVTSAGQFAADTGSGTRLNDIPVSERQPGGRRSDQPYLSAGSDGRQAVDAGQHFRRPRITNRTLSASY
jgi:hypothetical protein